MASTTDKIQLKAWFDEKSKLHIEDQDGREFEFVPEHRRMLGAKKVTQVKVDLQYPWWPDDIPYVEVTFRLPVEIRSASLSKMIVEDMEGR